MTNAGDIDLHDMTTEELGKLFPIIIVDYDKNWPDLFEKEKSLITDLFKQNELISIEHIGSTAIPNIKSKPTIDILIEVVDNVDIDDFIDKFKSIDYIYINQPENPPPHIMLVKGYSIHGFVGQVYHVHVRYRGDWEEIQFRNYLKNNYEVAKEYEKLKLQLADKHTNNREAYTEGKTEFINRVNKIIKKEK